MTTPVILLLIDFITLSIVVVGYAITNARERKFLKYEAGQSLELQQKIYQAEVLKEISERIGYSLDAGKIVEIITSSIGNLLDYDTVSLLILEEDKAVFKCNVKNSISQGFIQQVKQQIFKAYGLILGREISLPIEESLTGNILDEDSQAQVQSYFNLPVTIAGKLVGLINVSSKNKGWYGSSQASVFYTITNQATTAMSKLQDLLESEKGRLAAIIYALTDGVITVDLRGQLAVSNPAVKNILGIDTNKPLNMFDVIDALAGKVDVRTKIEQSLAQDKPVFVPEVYLKDKALEMVFSPVKNSQGVKLGVAVIFHDITTEKALEKLRQEFTAMMVHELRAPLTAVRWSSESLIKNLSAAQGVEPGKLKDTVVTIETASNNMLELVNDLLDVAKIEAGKFDLNIQKYDLVEVINEQAKAFTPQAQGKHLALNVISPPKLLADFDRVRISQVMGNLISNAIKYTDAGQIDINLTADEAKKQVVVAVKDTGIGVPRENLNQLFSKFKQLAGAEHSRKGTGLGLVVSKGIVEAHHGKIWAESPGENLGSTFYFSLPMV